MSTFEWNEKAYLLLNDLMPVTLGQFCLHILLAYVPSAVLFVKHSSMKLTLILLIGPANETLFMPQIQPLHLIH